MRWTEGFIAADWGTTNRRAYRIEGSGQCCDEFKDDRGVLSVAPGSFPAAVAEIRDRLGDLPLLLAGMIGSNKGWQEARYVAAPAGIDDLVDALVWPGEREAIVPGVSFQGDGRADVMRGEEVQLLGAVAAGKVPPNALVCHPGTHNKWARVEDALITDFRTVMTGELFYVLKGHSILADLLEGDAQTDEAFASGVRHALNNDDLPAELFSVRARVLLGEAKAPDAPSYTSGLLVGSDVRIGLDGASDQQIYVMGRPELTQLYAAAIREAGREPIELDGEQSFLSGIGEIAKRMS